MSDERTPSYYKDMQGKDLNEVFEGFGIAEDFYACNVIKYVVRAKKKGSYIQDLKKARHYIDLLIGMASLSEEDMFENIDVPEADISTRNSFEDVLSKINRGLEEISRSLDKKRFDVAFAGSGFLEFQYGVRRPVVGDIIRFSGDEEYKVAFLEKNPGKDLVKKYSNGVSFPEDVDYDYLVYLTGTDE